MSRKKRLKAEVHIALARVDFATELIKAFDLTIASITSLGLDPGPSIVARDRTLLKLEELQQNVLTTGQAALDAGIPDRALPRRTHYRVDSVE